MIPDIAAAKIHSIVPWNTKENRTSDVLVNISVKFDSVMLEKKIAVYNLDMKRRWW